MQAVDLLMLNLRIVGAPMIFLAALHTTFNWLYYVVVFGWLFWYQLQPM